MEVLGILWGSHGGSGVPWGSCGVPVWVLGVPMWVLGVLCGFWGPMGVLGSLYVFLGSRVGFGVPICVLGVLCGSWGPHEGSGVP